jgi:hypothetical protein
VPGIVLVVDDAHFADDAATDALLHLAGVSGGRRACRRFLPAGTGAWSFLAGWRGSSGQAWPSRSTWHPWIPNAAALVNTASPTSPDAKTVARIVILPMATVLHPRTGPQRRGWRAAGVTATIWDAVARFVDLGEGTGSMRGALL